MASNPLPFVVIIFATLLFEAALYGPELAEQSFGGFDEVPDCDEDGTPDAADSDPCPVPDCDGPIDSFLCGVEAILDAFEDFFDVVWGAIKFFFALVTFNVPGAPWWIRYFLSAVFIGGIVWTIATLFRGN